MGNQFCYKRWSSSLTFNDAIYKWMIKISNFILEICGCFTAKETRSINDNKAGWLGAVLL